MEGWNGQTNRSGNSKARKRARKFTDPLPRPEGRGYAQTKTVAPRLSSDAVMLSKAMELKSYQERA